MTEPTSVSVDREVLKQLVEAAGYGVLNWGEGNGAKMRLQQAVDRFLANAGWQKDAVVRSDHMDIKHLPLVQKETGLLGNVQHGLALLSTPSRASINRHAILKVYGTPPRDSEDQRSDVEVPIDEEWTKDILLVKAHHHRNRLASMGVKS